MGKTASAMEATMQWRRSILGSVSGSAPPLVATQASRHWLTWVVRSPCFELLFGALAGLDTIVMAIEVQYTGIGVGHQLQYCNAPRSSEEAWPAAEGFLHHVEWVFGVLFALELLVKLASLQSKFCRDLWQWLDVVIVGCWAFSRIGLLDETAQRMVRLLRLARVLRLLRAIKGLDSLYLLTTSLSASASALGWSSVLVLSVQAVFALVLGQVLQDFILDEGNDIEKRHQIYRYYGTPTRATLTMFELALANWPDASRPLTELVSEWYVLFVLGYQIVVGFAVVRVIMGVFLQVTFDVASTDNILMVHQKERAMRTHKKKVSRLFSLGDDDHNGLLDKEEFAQLVQDPVVAKWLTAMDCNVSLFAGDADELFALLDVSGCGELSAAELVAGVSRMKGPARAVDMAMLVQDNRELQSVLEEVREAMQALGGLPRTRADERARCRRGRRSQTDPGPSGASPLGLLAQSRYERQPAPDTSQGIQSPSSDGFALPTAFQWPSVGESLFETLATQVDRPPSEHFSPQGGELQRWVRSSWCTGFFAVAIVLNTLMIAAEVQYDGLDAGHAIGYPGSTRPAAELWPGALEAFFWLDVHFGGLFVVEAALKILALRCAFFKDAWHLLDILVIFFWLGGLLGQRAGLNGRVLRTVRLAKLLRIARLFRAIRGFDALYLMVTSIRGSCFALAWATALLLLVEAAVVLALGQVLEPFLLGASNSTEERLEVFRYFGTFSKGMLTMFEITLANWAPACRTLTEHVSEWFIIFTLIHKFIIGFAVVMVITGVIMKETFHVASTDDNVMMSTRERAVKEHARKMQKLFLTADSDGNGVVDREEFQAMLCEQSIKTWLSAMGLDVSDTGATFDLVAGCDADAGLTVQELVLGLDRLRGSARSVDLAVVLYESRQAHRTLQRLSASLCSDGPLPPDVDTDSPG